MMKVCVIQPLYSTDYKKSDELFEWEIKAFDQCDESMDLIVMPESCDVPAYAKTKEQTYASNKLYCEAILKKASETAKRCHSVVFINVHYGENGNLRNTTIAYDKNGNIAGKYFKQHLTPGETNIHHLDSDYTFEFSEPTVLEIDGIRYGFLTCYDFYFYEAFANMARYHIDIIIGCSHQRSDRQDALEMMSRFCAYNTNAYVVRSSVSMGESETIGGASMVVSPMGQVLLNMGSKVGMETTYIHPKEKYYKPGGFGNPMMAHYEYIEQGRRPWKYRPAGSAIVKPDDLAPYPRVCAHGGFNTIAPENSMPAFGAAVSLGAEEIAFDLWSTKDGEIISLQDATLDKVSNGAGKVWDYTYDELLPLDFGCKYHENYKGLKILKFEDILQKFSCHTIMNIHIKTQDSVCDADENMLKKIIALIDKYDCRKYVYFTSGDIHVIEGVKNLAPDIGRCMEAGDDAERMVDYAIRYACKKVQLWKPYLKKEMIDKAHAHGMKCNVFWSDDTDETVDFLNMGIDTILSNDYLKIKQAVNNYIGKKA